MQAVRQRVFETHPKSRICNIESEASLKAWKIGPVFCLKIGGEFW